MPITLRSQIGSMRQIDKVEIKGERFGIQVSDNVKVANVKVKIMNEDGMILEQGDALQADELWWSYTAQTLMEKKLKVEVEARDLAGNMTKTERCLGECYKYFISFATILSGYFDSCSHTRTTFQPSFCNSRLTNLSLILFPSQFLFPKLLHCSLAYSNGADSHARNSHLQIKQPFVLEKSSGF